MGVASRRRFTALFREPAGAIYDHLAARYAEPVRRYHTLEHIADCLGELDGLALAEPARRSIELALWWHDAVYDPTRSDNERRSAELAHRHLGDLGEPAKVAEEVARLIELTAGHAVSDADSTGAVLVSIDLAILGRDPEIYDRYAAAIRAEYAHVPEAAFRAGRAALMSRFLEATIYADPSFRSLYEARARANIIREIEALRAET